MNTSEIIRFVFYQHQRRASSEFNTTKLDDTDCSTYDVKEAN